jgi:hypothetical protein
VKEDASQHPIHGRFDLARTGMNSPPGSDMALLFQTSHRDPRAVQMSGQSRHLWSVHSCSQGGCPPVSALRSAICWLWLAYQSTEPTAVAMSVGILNIQFYCLPTAPTRVWANPPVYMFPPM